MIKYYRISQAALLLGVCTTTIRRWDRLGKIKCIRTVGNHRRISSHEIQRILEGKKWKKKPTLPGQTVIYSRVSSHEQKHKGDLQRQIEQGYTYCQQHNYRVDHVISDIASGLNSRRKGLLQLCNLINQHKVSRVIITYKDRLTRFGFDYLSSYFASHGTTIEIINEETDQSIEQELVADMIAIITSFSGKVYGLRSAKRKTQLKLTSEVNS